MTEKNEMLALAERIELNVSIQDDGETLSAPLLYRHEWDAIVSALRAAAASAEPVAWRWMNTAFPEHGWTLTSQEVKEHPSLLVKVEPLYTRPAPDAEIVAALEDVSLHQDVWRRLLVAQQTPIGSDDDGSYWAHELKVFDRTFVALAKAKRGTS